MSESDSLRITNDGRWNHRRMPVELDIEYWPMGGLKSRPGRMTEIGRDGFLLCLRERIEIAQKLRISILIDSGPDFMLIEPLVQVVWNDRPLNGRGHCFQNGARIIDISAREFQILEYFLQSLGTHRGSIKAPKYSGDL
jgi:hypothetical protein